jgi:tol-pal system protein YbgF
MMCPVMPGVSRKRMLVVPYIIGMATRNLLNHPPPKLLPSREEGLTLSLGGRGKGERETPMRSVGAHSHKTCSGYCKFLTRFFSLILSLLSLSGCLTRMEGPSLPYVRPAQSVPAVDPAPIQLSSRLQEMDSEMQRLREMIERLQAAGGNENAIRNLQERVSLIERHLGMEAARDVGSASVPPPPPMAPGVQRGRPADKYVSTPSSVRPPGPPVEIANAPVAEDEKAYRDAYALFKSGSLDQAVSEFEDFLKKYPKSQFCADSVYWIGEARFAQGRFDEAVLQFDRVLKDFPGSKKELSALLRQGQAFEKMGDSRSAKIIFQKLVSNYPHTAQARIAGGKLKSLAAE